MCQISVLAVTKSVRTSNLLFLQNSRKRKCSLESHFKKSDSSFHPCTKYDHMDYMWKFWTLNFSNLATVTYCIYLFKNQTWYFLNLRFIHYYSVWSVMNPPNSERWSPIFFNRLRKRKAWTFLINNLMFLLLDTMVHVLYNNLKSKKVQFKKAAFLKVNVFSKIFMRNIKQNFKKNCSTTLKR